MSVAVRQPAEPPIVDHPRGLLPLQFNSLYSPSLFYLATLPLYLLCTGTMIPGNIEREEDEKAEQQTTGSQE